MELTVKAIRMLKSIRSDKAFDVRSSKLRNMLIAREAEAMYMEMIAGGLHCLTPIVMFCAENNKKLHISCVFTRKVKIRDTDNIMSSFNKICIDPIVRAGILPSDHEGIIECGEKDLQQLHVPKRLGTTSITFAVSPTNATGLSWHRFLVAKGRIKE